MTEGAGEALKWINADDTSRSQTRNYGKKDCRQGGPYFDVFDGGRGFDDRAWNVANFGAEPAGVVENRTEQTPDDGIIANATREVKIQKRYLNLPFRSRTEAHGAIDGGWQD